MKIFISWSGTVSHDVAKSLKEWLPNVLQSLDAADVFLSSEDITKGAPWFQALGQKLDQCDFGILCLTRENMRAPWILFEAGAVSKRVETARVVPLLIGLDNADLESPLRELNASRLDKEEMRSLVVAIAAAGGEHKLVTAKLDAAFDAFWPTLEPRLQAAVATATSAKARYKYDVFLSAPMAGYSDDAAFRSGRADFKKVYDALAVGCGFRVYWAAKDIETTADYEMIDVSVKNDLAALDASRFFILLYPQRMVTSALFEAGYALALKQSSHYFVRDRADLPFLMRELAGAAQNVFIHEQQEWGDYVKLAQKLKQKKTMLFPD